LENPLQLLVGFSSVKGMKTEMSQVNATNKNLHKPGWTQRWPWGKSLLPAVLGCVLIGIAMNASSVPVQWQVANGGNGHFHEAILVGTNITWEESRAAAQLLGGDLATITTSAENAFGKSLFNGTETQFTPA
jgi:hypothetical protein